MKHTISVITICFNNLDDLIDTCRSVDQQLIEPYEHWIIDGSTTDRIKNYLTTQPQPAYRKWIAEKDSGIADAFNKGILRATGEIINMLNSGDRYANESTLSKVIETFNDHPEIQWMHGKYQLKRGEQWITIGKPFERTKLYRGMRSLSHQTMFIRKALHDKYGLYDTGLTIAMDYDFVCRMASEPFVFVNYPLVIFTPGGISNTNYLASLKQAKQVYIKYFGRSMMLSIWQLRLKILFYLLKSPIGKYLYKIKVWLGLENM
jgi:glycosyltransferase involved in cell wall biosynthesis